MEMSAMGWEQVLLRIGIAVALGTVIGVEREYKNRPAGMRTHVLVCLGACIVALMECMMRAEMAAGGDEGASLSLGRLSAQVISGIGFLGAGTIFISQKKIAGLTTAASLWNAACLGLAVGMGYYLIAVVGVIFVVVVLLMLQRIVRVNAIKRVEIKFVRRDETIAFINDYFEQLGVTAMDIDFHVDSKDGENLYTNIYTMHLPAKINYTDIISHLSECPTIRTIRTTNT
ncbi:MAG: MgtC/SapB family protein [Clostridiales bacterium]|nr:MgtC/SapB family protein [Clostridiales bacterium]